MAKKIPIKLTSDNLKFGTRIHAKGDVVNASEDHAQELVDLKAAEFVEEGTPVVGEDPDPDTIYAEAMARQVELQKGRRGGARPGAGRPRFPESPPDDKTTSVRILNTLAAMARLIAFDKDISVTEYLNGILLNPIRRDLDAMRDQLTTKLDAEGDE